MGTENIVAAATRPASDPVSVGSKWATVAVLMMGTALAILSTSVVGIATPRMQSTFSVSIDTLTWVLVVTTLSSLSRPVCLSSWFDSLLGRKRAYILSVMFFTGASLWCGLATSFAIMLVGRIVH